MANVIRGGCLCGAVSFEARGTPKVVAQCHCEECRKTSGTGHSVGAMFDKKNVVFQGSWQEYQYESCQSSTVTKAFCPSCGSPVFGSNTRIPEMVTLPLGLMQAAEELAIEVVIFARDRPDWDRLGEDVMQFETQPAWTPPES